MATYTLSGSGTQALTSGVVALHITITTLPASAGNGGASPLDYYGVGTLRPGNAAAFWEPFTICGGPQWMPVPFATTRLGYALRGNAVVSVVEVYSPAPLVFPLVLLPDVAIVSPADTQVLTYQSSTAKWINAAAPSGGGGGAGALTLIQEQAITGSAVSSLTFSAIPTTYRHLELWWEVKAVTATAWPQMRMWWNNITTSTYQWIVWGSGGTFAATGASKMFCGYVGNSTSGTSSSGKITIPYYARTVFPKRFTNSLMEWGYNRSAHWAGGNTATTAITRIDFDLDTGTLDVGSIWSLYGVS